MKATNNNNLIQLPSKDDANSYSHLSSRYWLHLSVGCVVLTALVIVCATIIVISVSTINTNQAKFAAAIENDSATLSDEDNSDLPDLNNSDPDSGDIDTEQNNSNSLNVDDLYEIIEELKSVIEGQDISIDELHSELDEFLSTLPDGEFESVFDDGIHWQAETSVSDAVSLPKLTLRSLSICGNTINYVDAFNAETAPSNCAGLWAGCDNVADGSYAYFVGHNPGVFSCISELNLGDYFYVCDSSGNTGSYEVIDEFIVDQNAHWDDIESRVTNSGESVVLQTCCDGGYLIVVGETF